jgi:hypothetical protein
MPSNNFFDLTMGDLMKHNQNNLLPTSELYDSEIYTTLYAEQVAANQHTHASMVIP